MENCLSATWFTLNPTQTVLTAYPGMHFEKLATKC